jgi:uncharacterized membrane protein YvbJ
MNCLSCGHNNSATVTYCQRCGGKLDLTADEISASLFDSAQKEQAKSTAFYARQSLFFSILLFLIAITVYVVSGGAPEQDFRVPSAATGAKYLKYEFKVEKKITGMDRVPVPEKK